jgi:hypothetical protein
MQQIDIDNMIKDLDFNQDGKISKEEFELWWLAGRKGKTGTMSNILSKTLGGKAFFSTMSSSMKRLAKQAQNVKDLKRRKS